MAGGNRKKEWSTMRGYWNKKLKLERQVNEDVSQHFGYQEWAMPGASLSSFGRCLEVAHYSKNLLARKPSLPGSLLTAPGAFQPASPPPMMSVMCPSFLWFVSRRRVKEREKGGLSSLLLGR